MNNSLLGLVKRPWRRRRSPTILLRCQPLCGFVTDSQPFGTSNSGHFPDPQIWEEIVGVESFVEVVSLVPQVRVPRQNDELFVDIPVPQMLEEIDEVGSFVSHEHGQRQNEEHSVDVFFPQMLKRLRSW